ncbi:MAG: Xaa-Pro peptidase family protein [Armatimonadetes bacterium]|nr:Xaa-Pro peptidase family protein [Armatimonadota bacterium]
MRQIPREELTQRTLRLQNLLREKGIDGALIVQNADLFYFAGVVQRAHLFIPAAGKPLLLVRKSHARARAESALENIVSLENPRELPAALAAHGFGPPACLGLELDVLPVNEYFRYQKMFPAARIVDVSPLIRQVRMVKSAYELELLKNAAALGREMFSRVREVLREGMTEVELAGQLEACYRRHGHQGYVRTRSFNMEMVYGHLLAGESCAVPSFLDSPTGGSGLNPSFPQGAGFKVIRRDEPVLIDYVAVLDGYMVDQSRIFCLGCLPEKLVRAHRAALEIQELLKERGRPGAICSELYDLAVGVAEKYGLQEYFMGYPEPVSFVGHGLGIELDELPVIARGFQMPLEEGMILALEPKFVFPEGGVGLENTFVVTSRGLETLTVFEEGIIYL